MSSSRILLFLLFILLSELSMGQKASVLKAEGIQKMNVFTGTWKSENDTLYKDRTSAIFNCKWSPNGKYLICDQIVSGKAGKTNNLAIYSFDSNNHYQLSLVGIPGVDPFSIPVISKGDTLVYPGSYTSNGHKIYNQTLNIFTNYKKYRFIVQYSEDSIHWTTTLAGTTIKL